MAPGIHQTNAGSWDTLVISILKVDLLRTTGTIPYQYFININQDNNAIVNSEVDEILLHENQKVSAEKEAHENIESDFYENKTNWIDNMSLDDKK